MNVIVAGEKSGVIRDAFARRGHNAWSCDMEPSSSAGGQHYQGNWHDIHWQSFDLLIALRSETYLGIAEAMAEQWGNAHA